MADDGPASPGDGWDDLILVGVIARTHGIKGHVIVNPHSDFVADRFVEGARFHGRLANATRQMVTVTTVRIQQGRPIIGIEGVTSISEAEPYQGTELKIEPGEQQPLPAGQYYHHQLMGCEAVTPEGALIGRVVEVASDTGQSRLVVAGPHRRHEIPLADDICTVDVAGRRIIVRAPEGLLEL